MSMLPPTSANRASETVTTPKRKQCLDRSSMSPTLRTELWLHGPTPKQDHRTTNIHKTKSGKISKTIATSMKGLQKKGKSRWNIPFLSRLFIATQKQYHEDNLEGDTLVEEEHPHVSPASMKGYTLILEDKEDPKTALDFYRNRSLNEDISASETWTDDENWVFDKLSKRGYEPLLPASWQLDFPSFPDILFSEDGDRTFVKNTNSSIPHAASALNNLIQAGPRCRDQIQADQSPERPLDREINAYVRWSLLDSQLRRKPHIPVVTTATAKPNESVESVVHRMTDKLHCLGRQYRDKWRHPDFEEADMDQEYTHEMPTLYGFVVKYSVVAIVTYDSSVPGKPIRTLSTLDFQKVGQDVWQALAIAIVVIKGRNYLKQLEEEQELGEEIDDESDPDA